MSIYANIFKDCQPNHDPRHIEAFVRLQYGTLNHLDRETLKREADIAAACIEEGGTENAEALAQSYGL
ncbi:MAG TPA: hypothetical protein VFL54_09055 [Gammaproteobacteria bacterium]|nr:hypothetical protein [Gammaproteobacteria bacterium]